MAPPRKIAPSTATPVVLMKVDVDGMLIPVPDPTPVGGAGGSSGGLTNSELRASAVPVSGPLTDAQLRAAAVPVSDGGASLTVDGSVSVSNFPASQPVTGPLTDAQLRAAAVPVSGPLTDAQLRATAVPVSGSVAVSNMIPAVETGLAKDGADGATPPAVLGGGSGIRGWLRSIYEKLTGTLNVSVQNASLPVTGTFWQATQPVSGPLTDAQLRATPVPVSGTVTATGPLTDAQLRATPVPVSGTVTATGPLTDAQLRASRVPTQNLHTASSLCVSGTAAAAAAVTVTLPAAGAGLFHYITNIEVVLYNTVARAGGVTPVLVSTTNFPAAYVMTFPSAGAVGACDVRTINTDAAPIKSLTANTATTIACPATASVIWRVNVTYYTGP